MEVFLIGLNHKYQFEGYNSDWQKFFSFLKNKARDTNADLIGEELNEEAITLRKAIGSVAEKVADSLGIRHVFYDPDSSQRKILGIKSGKEIAEELGYGMLLTREQYENVSSIERSFWYIRESYWLEKLLEQGFEKCISIIGSDHIDTFCQLLESQKLEYRVIEREWQA